MQPWEVNWCHTTLYHLIQHQWGMLLGFSLRYPWCLFLLWFIFSCLVKYSFLLIVFTVSCNSIRSGLQLLRFKTVRICHGFLMTHHSWDRKIFLTFFSMYLVSRLYSWPSIFFFVLIILNWFLCSVLNGLIGYLVCWIALRHLVNHYVVYSLMLCICSYILVGQFI